MVLYEHRSTDEVRELLARELAPRAAAIEAGDDFDAVRAAARALGDAGLLALSFGERPRPLTRATVLSEEAAALSYAFESTIATAISCAHTLQRHATPAVRDARLDAILSGRELGAICVTEEGAGSDAAGMRTRIRLDPARGEWVIDGAKRFISNASVAGTYVVYGITDPDVAPQRGMSAVVVPAGTPGLSFPRRYHLMGRRGCVVGEAELHDCRVPADHLLGERDAGFRILVGMLNFERILAAGAALGVARSAFELARAHAQAREAFGAPLGAKQLVWDRIAEMSWRLEAARLLTGRAAELHDAGVPAKEVAKPAAMAKLVAGEAALLCADATVQILGGEGLAREFGRAEQIYRDARALTIAGGTAEMLRYLIASADLPDLRLDL